LTEQNDDISKYAAGIKFSAAMNTAMIVLLDRNDNQIVKRETLSCSHQLSEVSAWLAENTADVGASLAAGLDSSQVRFLDIRIPAVTEAQLLPLLRTQAEAMLPLSADQMGLAWQAEQDKQGLHCNTAVIRRKLLQPLLDQPTPIRHITPDAVGLAAVWNRGKDGPAQCILLLRRSHDFLVAMVNDGHLQRSAVIDAEAEDLQNASPTGLLLQDIQTELESLQAEYRKKVPVFLLAEASSDVFLKSLRDQIQDIGWDSKIVPLSQVCNKDCQIEAIEAYGLALTAATEQVDYDFQRAEAIQRPNEDRTTVAAQVRKVVALTVLLLAAALGTSYWNAKHEVTLLREVMATENDGLSVQQVLDAQSYRETVARARPDMTGLFERIHKCKGDILLDTFEFEKGKPVKINATAKGYDGAYAFQKKLETENKNVITGVRLLEPRLDQKSNQVRFMITFHYRNFSK
jgi:hypothetical protein